MSNLSFGVAGRFKLEVSGGKRGRVVLAEFDNLIVDSGLNMTFNPTAGVILGRCQLGTGAAAPTGADNTLQIPGPATTTVQRNMGGSGTYVAGPPDYVTDFITFRFATGTATGTWSEVGITGNSSPFTLFSRALIVNAGGSPTPITILADEQLDVTYTVRVYPPQSDITGSITLDGTSHSYTIRPLQMGTGGSGSWSPHWIFNQSSGFASGSGTQGLFDVYSGGVAARTATAPNGTQTVASAVLTPAAYSNNSLVRSFEVRHDLNEANVAGGFRTMRVYVRSSGTLQCGLQIEFVPNVLKVNTKVLRLNFQVSLARRP